jgi:hypothetical protein
VRETLRVPAKSESMRVKCARLAVVTSYRAMRDLESGRRGGRGLILPAPRVDPVCWWSYELRGARAKPSRGCRSLFQVALISQCRAKMGDEGHLRVASRGVSLEPMVNFA